MHQSEAERYTWSGVQPLNRTEAPSPCAGDEGMELEQIDEESHQSTGSANKTGNRSDNTSIGMGR